MTSFKANDIIVKVDVSSISKEKLAFSYCDPILKIDTFSCATFSSEFTMNCMDESPKYIQLRLKSVDTNDAVTESVQINFEQKMYIGMNGQYFCGEVFKIDSDQKMHIRNGSISLDLLRGNSVDIYYVDSNHIKNLIFHFTFV